MGNYANYQNMHDLMTQVGNRLDSLEGAYKPRGSVTFANLPSTLTAAMLGYVWDVSDAFTTDSRFREGAGVSYPAGTNVGVIDVGSAGTPDYKFDTFAGFIDTAAFTTRINAIRDDLADEFDATTAYNTGDIVTYNDVMYKFDADHAAGAWIGSDAHAVQVADLIADAEPDSLTQSQMNALLALLGYVAPTP